MTCEKRSFPSKHAAREAVKTMGNTVRVYRCPACAHFHVTKDRTGMDVKRQPRRLRET